MAGVLEQLRRPQKRAVVHCNPKALELQTAKEILAEVFRVRLSEVDEMLKKMGCGHRSFGLKGKASLSLASSQKIGSRSASFIPAHLLNLLRSIFLPLLVRCHLLRVVSSSCFWLCPPLIISLLPAK
jgi:hypothetical protein